MCGMKSTSRPSSGMWPFSLDIGDGSSETPFSGRAYDSLRRLSSGSDLLAWNLLQLHTGSGDQSKVLTGALVSGDAFSILQIHPAKGSFFDSGSDLPGGGVRGWSAVLSYKYWKENYASDPNIIGRIIDVDGEPVQIQGILPPDFKGLTPPLAVDILLPLRFQEVSSPKENRYANAGYFDWYVFGRRKPGVSTEAIRANLKTIGLGLRADADPDHWIFRDVPHGALIKVVSGQYGTSQILKLFSAPLTGMEIVGGGLFALCGANLGFLFIGKTIRENHATAVRLALGASRLSILRLACIEASALACLGGVIAIPIAWAVTKLLIVMVRSIPGVDSFQNVGINMWLAGFGILISWMIANASAVGATLWFGAVQPASVLGGSNKTKRPKFIPFILGLEIVLGLFLLIIAVMSVNSVYKLSHLPSGFDGDAVVANVELAQLQQDPLLSSTHMEVVKGLLEEYPGVVSVSSIGTAPLTGASANATYATKSASGQIHKDSGIWPAMVSGEYLNTIGTKLVSGRDFKAGNQDDYQSCLISQRAALSLFGDQSPLHQLLYQSSTTERSEVWQQSCEVIGVVQDAHFKSMSDPSDKVVYRMTATMMTNLLVRARSGQQAKNAVEHALRAGLPITYDASVKTIDELVASDLTLSKVLEKFVLICAGVTALILILGIFGVLSLEVARNRRNIGIYLSFGARTPTIIRWALNQIKWPLAIGSGIGCAFIALLQGMLSEAFRLSAATVVAACAMGVALVTAAVVIGALLPIRRALSISPAECIRAE